MKPLYTDSRKNRLYIYLHSDAGDNIRQTLNQLEGFCLNLRQQFTCLIDISNCVPMTKAYQRFFRAVENRISELGLGKVVWLLAEGIEGRNQMDKLPLVTSNRDPECAQTITEAEHLLDGFNCRLQSSLGRKLKQMFKIIDMSGWEDEGHIADFRQAQKRLNHLRKMGRRHAIIVPASAIIQR